MKTLWNDSRLLLHYTPCELRSRFCLLIKLLILKLIIVTSCHAAEFKNVTRFSNIGLQQGLSQSTVLDILQDRQGFMWFATYDGLNRYDGYQFKVFRSNQGDSNSLTSNFITRLALSDDGYLWIGTLDGGLNRYHLAQNRFEKMRLPAARSVAEQSTRILQLFVSRQNQVFVATNQQRLYVSNDSQEFTSLTTLDNKPLTAIRHIAETGNGDVWVASEESLFRIDSHTLAVHEFDANNQLRQLIKTDKIQALHSHANTLWIKFVNSGVVSLNLSSNQLDRFPQFNEQQVTHINWIDDELWMSTVQAGVIVFNPLSKQVTSYAEHPSASFGIINNYVHATYKDRSGVIWIGTDAGLSKYVAHNNRFNHWRIEATKSEKDSASNMVWSLHDFKNYLLLGTQSGLIAHPKNNQTLVTDEFLLFVEKNLKGHIVHSVDSANDKQIFAATDKGLWVFSGITHQSNKSYSKQHLLPGVTLNTLRSYGDSLWVGSERRGLYQFSQQNLQLTRHYQFDENNASSISSNSIYAIYRDRHQHLWVGTDNGLNRLLDNGSFVRFQSGSESHHAFEQ